MEENGIQKSIEIEIEMERQHEESKLFVIFCPFDITVTFNNIEG
jgi:uncharacterized OsmC-like protein